MAVGGIRKVTASRQELVEGIGDSITLENMAMPSADVAQIPIDANETPMWGTVAVKARCRTSARGSLPVTFDRAGRRATTQSRTRRNTHVGGGVGVLVRIYLELSQITLNFTLCLFRRVNDNRSKIPIDCKRY